MDPLLQLLYAVARDVIITFRSVLPWLGLGIVTAAALSTYLGPARIAAWLERRGSSATAASVGAAVLTPFCSCGTTAVVLSMIAATAPWAPIVAFMVASPLTSPGELFLSAGLFGWPFALVFFVGTALIGLGAGAVAARIERRGWLAGQARFSPHADEPCAGGACHAPAVALLPATRAPSLRAFGREAVVLGRKMLLYFFGFATLGYLIVELVPQSWLLTLLGGDSILSTVFASTVGIPLYMTSEGSLPLVAELMDGGLGAGPAMAFLVTGAGTSVAAISGSLLIARRRVVGLVVGTLWLGGIALGTIAGALLVG